MSSIIFSMADKNEFLRNLTKTAWQGLKTASPYVIATGVYTKIFHHRIDSDIIHRFDPKDFPQLEREKCIFKSEKNKLTGYTYHYRNYDDKKIIIFAHGYGNGHKRYLDVIDQLCFHGYKVFAYDMTGFDESEGKGIRSFPQAIIDLNNAIAFIRKKYKHQDIYLVGHSMGGYAVGCNLSLNKDIKKAVIISGFNKSSEIVKDHGEEWVGEDAAEITKYIDAYEEAFFGDYAKMSVIESVSKSTAKCLFIHSKDDKTVLYPTSFALYYQAFKDRKGFDFISYDDRGHGTVYDSVDGRRYYEYLVNEIKKFKKANPKASEEEINNYFLSIIDKSQWLNMTDRYLFNRIDEFLKD